MKMRYSGSRSPNAKVIHSVSKKWAQLRNSESKLEFDGLPRLKFDHTIPHEALPDQYAYEQYDSIAMPDTSYVSAMQHGDYSNSEEIKPSFPCVYPHVHRNCAIPLSSAGNLGCGFHVPEQFVSVGDAIPNCRYADTSCFQIFVTSNTGGVR